MTNVSAKGIVQLTVIAGKQQKDPLIEAIAQAGGLLMDIAYGRGTVRPNRLMDLFGLISEEKKVFITCLLSAEKADGVFKILLERFNFDKPNTGIAFSVPVEKISL